MPMLFVRCHQCHRPFPSGIAHDGTQSGHIELLNVLEQCPHCGESSRYSTHEFFVPSAEPAQVDQPLDTASDLPAPASATAEPETSEEPPHDQGPPVGSRNRPVNVRP